MGLTYGDFVCVVDPDGGTHWARRANVRRTKLHQPKVTDWLGRWAETDGDDWIDVTLKDGQLHARGMASWPEAHPSGSELPREPHRGELNNPLQMDGPALRLSTGDPDLMCNMSMRLIDGRLWVVDNLHCGGVNVSFTGEYERAPAHN